jgi:hypothetical protein
MASNKKEVAKEEDFQEVANKHAHGRIETMREELDSPTERENICSEGALEVQVRGDWHTPGDKDSSKPTEYYILLGTGGPADRIRGKLNQYGEAETAEYEFQDWYKPWTAADDLSTEEEATLLEYAHQFYFGE